LFIDPSLSLRAEAAAQVHGRNKDWRLFFNTMFWNLNYRDSASTMAGEVDRPERTFPRALGVAVVLIAASYLLPLMAATGATNAQPEEWENGYLVDAAGSTHRIHMLFLLFLTLRASLEHRKFIGKMEEKIMR
jgi:amino acid transporter